MTKLLLVLLFPIMSFAQGVSPSGEGGDQTEVNLRYFHKDHLWTYVGEIKGQEGYANQTYHSYKLGAYYRWHENLKIGLFYKQQFGKIHDDDWTVVAPPWGWDWVETGTRREDVYIFDITPRMLLGDSTVADLKMRYSYNDFNDDQVLRVRPGLTYFATRKGKPLLNVFLQYERYIPLNFGNYELYEQWFYFGTLFHLSKHFKPGLFVAKRTTWWEENEEFKTAFPGEGYRKENSAPVFGINLLFFNK